MARYAWIIDTDHLFDGTIIDRDETGVTGPDGAGDDLLAKLAAGEGTKFRMYDDDGELYYSGRYIGAEAACDPRSEWAFGPLDDFGTPNAGATEIRYHVGHNRYETL